MFFTQFLPRITPQQKLISLKPWRQPVTSTLLYNLPQLHLTTNLKTLKLMYQTFIFLNVWYSIKPGIPKLSLRRLLQQPSQAMKPIFNIMYKRQLMATKRRQYKYKAKSLVAASLPNAFIHIWILKALFWTPTRKLWKKILFIALSLLLPHPNHPIIYWYRRSAIYAIRPKFKTKRNI